MAMAMLYKIGFRMEQIRIQKKAATNRLGNEPVEAIYKNGQDR